MNACRHPNAMPAVRPVRPVWSAVACVLSAASPCDRKRFAIHTNPEAPEP